MLVILDKDGTLVKPKSGAKFVNRPDDQELLPGVAERIAAIRAMGASIAIASNQGGIAAGHKTIESVIVEMHFCLTLIGVHDIRVYFCPDFEGGKCIAGDWRGFSDVSWMLEERDYRKPGAGMLLLAMKEAMIPPNQTIMIGDMPEDEAAAKAAGVKFLDAEAWRSGASA